MLPWGHAAVGYLLYSLALGYGDRQSPDGWAVLALGFGTQFPDLVDKPLAWTFAVLPAGRSLAHSTLTLGVVGLVVLGVAHRRGAVVPAVAFLTGYASHLVTDAVAPVVYGDLGALNYLLYPLVPVRTPGHDYNLLIFFLTLEPTPLLSLGAALTGVALWQWHRDGTPGLDELVWSVDRLSSGTSDRR